MPILRDGLLGAVVRLLRLLVFELLNVDVGHFLIRWTWSCRRVVPKGSIETASEAREGGGPRWKLQPESTEAPQRGSSMRAAQQTGRYLVGREGTRTEEGTWYLVLQYFGGSRRVS